MPEVLIKASAEVRAYMSLIGSKKTEAKARSSRANAAKAAQARKRNPFDLPCSCGAGDVLLAEEHKATCPRGRLLKQRAREEKRRASLVA